MVIKKRYLIKKQNFAQRNRRVNSGGLTNTCGAEAMHSYPKSTDNIVFRVLDNIALTV